MSSILEMAKGNLLKRGYQVTVAETAAEAAIYLDSRINRKTVGIGGSVTVSEMGLYPLLAVHNEVCWHDRLPEGMSVDEARRKACASEVYISSVNGMSLQGEIINIDNTGNRVSAISYGPRKVYLVVGVNKIEDSFEKAMWRARNIAAPLNAQRLHRNTPCAVNADKCYDCACADRICRNLSVLWNKPTGTEIEVVLINEAMGF